MESGQVSMATHVNLWHPLETAIIILLMLLKDDCMYKLKRMGNYPKGEETHSKSWRRFCLHLMHCVKPLKDKALYPIFKYFCIQCTADNNG